MAQAYVRRGIARVALGTPDDLQAAMDDYNRGIELAPKSVEAYRERARLRNIVAPKLLSEPRRGRT